MNVSIRKNEKHIMVLGYLLSFVIKELSFCFFLFGRERELNEKHTAMLLKGNS